VVGAGLAGLLLLTACSGSNGGSDEKKADVAPTTPPFTISYAHEIEFDSYNDNTRDVVGLENASVLNQVLRGFWSYAPDGEIVPDKEFGSYERVSGNPLTVRYTFAPKATWSDGNPIDCDDAVLAWAANSGRWPTGRSNQITGLKYTAFSSKTPAAWANVGAPQCQDGDKSFTVTFDRVFADWQQIFGQRSIMPAHIVEKESGVKDVIAAVRADKPGPMIELGDIYNSIWFFEPGQFKADISPSAGPYEIASWDAGRAVTLKRNPRWWGTPGKATSIVVKVIPSDEQVKALRAGEVQVIDPVPTPQLVAQLKAKGAPVQSSAHDSFVWEHLDFNFSTAFKNVDLRRAFAKCVPRQQIVDNLIKPLNPQAKILESRLLLPFQPGYDAFTNIGGQAYDKVDIAGARKILKARHKLGMKVRIAYRTPDPRRRAEVALIRDLCGQAGFKVVDEGTPEFFYSDLTNGDFDVALFAWTGSSRVTQSYATYMSNGVQNNGGYSSPEVDLLLKQLYSELDPDQQRALMVRLDTKLWADLATIPLFASPGLLATAAGVQGVQYNPGPSGTTYNQNTWLLAK
jgi:peptide/nickel transport system substrate-binding protein